MKIIFLLLVVGVMPFLPALFERISRSFNRHVHIKTKSENFEEACKILELDTEASEEDIKSAHKRLIQKNHPDAGGSKYLASKINEARDILLSNLKR